MNILPRSLRIREPYRGRTLRHMCDSLPFGRRLRLAREERVRRQLVASGRRSLTGGVPEGPRYLTALPHPFCGIGHSASEWNTAYLWAPQLGLEFVNTPLQEPWASFLGFGRGARTYWDVLREERPVIVRLPYAEWSATRDPLPELEATISAIHSKRPVLFVLADRQNCFDHTANAERLRSDFRAHGQWNHLPRHQVRGRCNVAVHVRRGDVAAMKARQSGNWQERYVEPDWFARVIARVRHESDGAAQPLFHIYSQGRPEEFSDLARMPDVRLHLEAAEQETLLNMIEADVLVMSPSGFSYLAAILSGGRKIARAPWWHHLPATKGWTLVSAA